MSNCIGPSWVMWPPCPPRCHCLLSHQVWQEPLGPHSLRAPLGCLPRLFSAPALLPVPFVLHAISLLLLLPAAVPAHHCGARCGTRPRLRHASLAAARTRGAHPPLLPPPPAAAGARTCYWRPPLFLRPFSGSGRMDSKVRRPEKWDATLHTSPSNPVVFLEFAIAGQPVGRAYFELFADRVYVLRDGSSEQHPVFLSCLTPLLS